MSNVNKNSNEFNSPMINWLRDHFAITPKHEINQDWGEIKKKYPTGPIAKDYLFDLKFKIWEPVTSGFIKQKHTNTVKKDRVNETLPNIPSQKTKLQKPIIETNGSK